MKKWHNAFKILALCLQSRPVSVHTSHVWRPLSKNTYIFFFNFLKFFKVKYAKYWHIFCSPTPKWVLGGQNSVFAQKSPFFCPKSGCIGFRDPSIMRSAQIHMKRLPYFFFINFWWFCVFTDWRNLYRGPRYDLLKLR